MNNNHYRAARITDPLRNASGSANIQISCYVSDVSKFQRRVAS